MKLDDEAVFSKAEIDFLKELLNDVIEQMGRLTERDIIMKFLEKYKRENPFGKFLIDELNLLSDEDLKALAAKYGGALLLKVINTRPKVAAILTKLALYENCTLQK